MNYHAKSNTETLVRLETDENNGLLDTEVKKRQEKFGYNEIKNKKQKSNISKFLAQFNDFMVITLLIAGLISFITSIIKGEKDFFDSIIIIFIVILNAIFSFLQENKAEKALEELKKLKSPKTNVIRNGILQKIDSTSLVVGDIIFINAGDYVAADARILKANNLKVEEANLTGESIAIEKTEELIQKEDIGIHNKKNMVFSGSNVVAGNAKAVVVAIGMDTEIGKIANMIINTEEKQTNLQKKLNQTGKILSIIALFICVLIFFIGILKNIKPFEMFMTSISLAVAAIPEGLPSIVTIMLAIGVFKMVKQNAIVRKMPAVESLGAATVICTDKTGTLTQNKMTVVKYKSQNKDMLCTALAVCNSVAIDKKVIGEPTEVALVNFAIKNGFNKNEVLKRFPFLFEISFNSERKLMSTIHKDDKGYKIFTKGALDILLEKCTYYYENYEKKLLTESKKKDILRENMQMTKEALRVIAVAFKDTDKASKNDKNIENNLIFLGLVGMIDPPRKEVFDAIKCCHDAGIKTVMITGDHVETAKAIGKKVGLFLEDGICITGSKLDNMTDKELAQNIQNYSIFARVSPAHKVRIVKAFKANDEIVAMTGDGVNDAPALKEADIGCAMGLSGTEVAKGASDIILADDNFSTIVYAIKEGRGIYQNIKKSVHFLISSNIGEIVTIFFALIIGYLAPLSPIHLLWINLITDCLPAIALSVSPNDKDLMQKRVKRIEKGLFEKYVWLKIFLEGILIGTLALIAYIIGIYYFNEESIAKTMTFATLSISQLVHSFNLKSEKSIFNAELFNNKYLIFAFIIGIILQAVVIMIPFLANIFGVSYLSYMQWSIVLILSLMPLAVVELEKKFTK